MLLSAGLNCIEMGFANDYAIFDEKFLRDYASQTPFPIFTQTFPCNSISFGRAFFHPHPPAETVRFFSFLWKYRFIYFEISVSYFCKCKTHQTCSPVMRASFDPTTVSWTSYQNMRLLRCKIFSSTRIGCCRCSWFVTLYWNILFIAINSEAIASQKSGSIQISRIGLFQWHGCESISGRWHEGNLILYLYAYLQISKLTSKLTDSKLTEQAYC